MLSWARTPTFCASLAEPSVCSPVASKEHQIAKELIIMPDTTQGIARAKQDEDLKENPGIGPSKGAYASGEELDDADGDNTVEGDVENDPQGEGSVDPNRLGRTNP